ncbi:hypothetical protein [Winogradskyella ouciana]|uniref:Lipoprotein n=1 Tax=Winogradskyella ouciana TaxID=2608631 RepID=A0A7K1GDZ5_9FLAO|nr:hypothetical protein [Winogradskyella ouciana]MTE26069.1 hypothetical protein [Winogradskyella ouciana]
MKKFILVILGFSLCFACGNETNKSDTALQQEDKASTTTASKAIPKPTDAARKLANTTPLNEDVLVDLFPETLLDMNRTTAGKGTLRARNASGANAIYHGPDKKSMSIAITDCAGVDGAKLYKRYSKYKTKKEDTENSTSTTTYFSKNGMEGKVIFIKSLNQHTLDLLYQDRLVMTIGATHIELNKIWEAIEVLPLSELLNQ